MHLLIGQALTPLVFDLSDRSSSKGSLWFGHRGPDLESIRGIEVFIGSDAILESQATETEPENIDWDVVPVTGYDVEYEEKNHDEYEDSIRYLQEPEPRFVG